MRTLLLLCVLVGCDEQPPGADSAGTLAPGLAAWFPMDSVESGMIVELVTGVGGNCTGSSCPTVTDGVRSGALLFDGVRQMVTAPSPAALNVRASFTIAVWTRTDSVSSTVECPVNKLGPVGNAWQLCIGASVESSYWMLLGGQLFAQGGTIEVGRWYHFAATWDAMSTELRLYQDGLGVGDVVLANLAFDDGPITIGADVDQGNPFGLFPGAIDDVRIYDVVLDPVRLQQLANP